MKVTTLYDAAEYQRGMIARMANNRAATEKDHYMTKYILEILEDRILEKETKNERDETTTATN